MAAYAAHTSNKSTLLTAQVKDKTRATFRKMGVWGKRGQENGLKADRKSDRTRQKNKRGNIEKWDQTDSPEIPDRGKTS